MKPKFRNIFFRRAKSRALCQATASLLSGIVLFSSTPIVWALPSNGTVVAGDAVINQGGNSMTIDQISSKAIIDWQRFGITSSEALRFLQPDKSSVILNRVTGTEASHIFGELTANGRVFIVNPNGILFGAGSSIDVAGLMATTLNIKNEDFMAGNYTFSQDDAKKLAYVVNEGRITIGDNGFAYLVAPGVENKGVIVAKAGQVVMASGKQAYVDFSGDGLVKFKVSGKITEKIIGPDGKPMASAVSNSGTIQAQGGQVLLSGDTAREVVTSVVNNSGVIEASSFGDLTGSVRMEARKGGDVINNGKISVEAKNKGQKSGKVVLSGENIGQFGTINADAKDGKAGTIELRASNVVALSNNSVTTANAVDRGNGGTILVIGENSARVGTGAVLQARGGMLGGDGGFIETSGHKSFEIGSIADVSATAGRAGTWLIDPADLVIVAGSTDTNISSGNGAFTSTGNSAQLGVELILNALANGNVVIKTGENGSQPGNITVNADIQYVDGTNGTLTLDAHNNIIINKNISSTNGKLNVSLTAGGNVSLTGTATISTNGGSFTSTGLGFSMAGTSSINAGSGAIAIKNTGNVSLFNLNGGSIDVTQADGIDITGTVKANGAVTLVAKTGSITTSGSGIIEADILNLTTLGKDNASIGKVEYGVDAGGSATVTMTGLNVKVNTLNASTQSGLSNGVSTGNIIINNSGKGNLDLDITTNGDKGDNDIASVMIKSENGGITGQVDAFSASFTAKDDINLETNLSVLRAETTYSGSITINNKSGSLFILGLVAREYGSTAMLNNGDIKAMKPGKYEDGKYIPGDYVDGTKNISITSSGDIGLQGDISATKKVSLTSTSGSIVNAINGTGVSAPTITSSELSLTAAGAIGSLGGAIKTLTGSRIDISAGTVEVTIYDPEDRNKFERKEVGGIYLEEVNRLNIGTIKATGSQGNINLKATSGNAYFAFLDSKITANGSVTIDATAGNIQTHSSNTGDVIDAKSIILSAKSIGTAAGSINTKTGALTVRATDGELGRINIKNSSTLSSINVVTPGVAVDIVSTGAVLRFGKDEMLSITKGTGTTLNFSNTLGGIKFSGIDLGSNDLTLNAAKAVTQSSGTLVAGNVTIIAGENIGTSTKSLQTKVLSLNLSSGKNGIYIDQESSGLFKLNAVASGDASDIWIVQKGSGNMEIKKVVSAKGGVTLKSSGSIINGNDFLSEVNISGNSLFLTAAGSIGADGKSIITNVSKAGGNAVFEVEAKNGKIVIENSGNIALRASTFGTGDINFINAGSIALGELNAGSNRNVTLTAKGAITDANGDTVNITAKNLNLRATSIASGSDSLDISVEKLEVTTTSGGLYLKQRDNNDFYLTNATSSGTVSIEAGGTIHLGVIDALAQSVVLKSETGDIFDNRTSTAKANVNAKSLDISARNLGTDSKRLSLNVGILSASSSGNTFAENLGSLHVTADSLTGKGAGQTVSIIASDITVFDNSGGTTTLDNNGSLELIAKNGNIIFLNTNDTIRVTGSGSIYFEALGTSLDPGQSGLAGLIVTGNLITDGGNITLKASSHISINLLNAGKGNVTVQSNNGLIIDNNGDKINIIGKNVVLSGKSVSESQLTDDRITAISNVGDKTSNLNNITLLLQYAKDSAATLEGLVAQYTQLYNQSLSEVGSKETNLAAAQKKANDLYQTLMGLTAALDAANLAASILEIPAGAAQAIPLVGDGGTALALGILNSVLAGMQLGVNQAERASNDAENLATDLAIALSELKANLHTNKQLMDSNGVLLDAKNVEVGDLTQRAENAGISLAASKIIEALTAQAAKNNNVIGSSSQALGIQAERVDATAFGQSNVYIESPGSIGVGDITAHGKGTVVEVTAKNDINLIGTTTSSKNIVLYSENGAITAGAGSKLVSDDLVAVAKNGIGTNGAALNTTVKRIAATTENGGAHFVNTNGSEALSIDEISVSTSNLTKTVTGVTARGDVQVKTSGDLVLNKAVRNTSMMGTVTLIATDGSITGSADNSLSYHVEGGTLIASAANGIGSDAVALRTDITRLTVTVSDIGLVNISEKDAIELTGIRTANGSISVNAGGGINAISVVSATDAEGNTITLNAANGNIIAGTISAGRTHGDITLSALGGQVNNDGNTSTRITGRNLIISANSGIGAAGANANTSLDTSVARLIATTGTGVINISESDDLDVKNVNTSDGNITIVSAGGDLNISQIVASGTGNTVTLDANGKIVSAIAPGDKNGAIIIAANLAATAGTGIGSAGNFIEIDVNNLAAKTTSGGIYFNDLSGDLIIGGVTPNLGRPALNGLEAGTGSIVITTVGGMSVEEGVTARDGDILLSASGGDITTTAAIASTTGDVTMDAFGNITIGGAVTAGKNVEMTAGKAIESNGAIVAGNNILLTATGGYIRTSATVTATTGDVTMDASGDVIIGGTVTAGDNVLVKAKGGDISTSAAVLATTGDVKMTAGKRIGIKGSVAAANDVLLTAKNGDILTEAAVTATAGNVTMDASGSVTIGAAVTAGDNVLVSAKGGDILTTATLTAALGDVIMDAYGNITIGDTVTAAKNVKMTAGKAIDINGVVTAGNDVLLKAIDGDITTTESVTATLGKVEMSAGDISYGSSGNITIGATVTAGTDVFLKVKGGDITTSAAIEAGNNVEMTAGGLYFGSSGNITIGATVTAGNDVTMTAGKAIGINGAVTAGNDVLLVAQNGDITTTAAVDAGNNVAMTAGDVARGTSGNVRIGDTVTAGNDVLLKAIGGNIWTTAAVTATLGNVTMDASGNITIGGTVTAGQNVEMTAGLDIEINGAVTAGNDVLLTAKGGDITTTESVTATVGDVNMVAFGNITIGEPVTAGNDVIMTAGKGIEINGAITAGNDVLLRAIDGDILTTAAIMATLGNVTMDASDNVTIGDSVTANKNVLVTAKDGFILTNAAVTATTGNVEMTAGLGIEINGAVTAGNDVLLTAKGGDITTTESVTATVGDVNMAALGNITIGEPVTAGNDVIMTAGKGIEINGAITAGNDVLLTAIDGDILTTATIMATLGDVTMDASDNVTIGATVTADKNVFVTAKDGFILTNAAVTATTGNVEMTAGLGIEINGAITAGNDVLLTAIDGDILTTATIMATLGDVTMDASDNVTIGDSVTANKNVFVTAKDGFILTNAAVTATTGNVEMTAGLGIEINGAVTAANNVLLTAEGGDIETTALGTITATLGDVTLGASDNITIGATVTADKNVTMAAGQGIVINDAVTASKEDVLLTAEGGDIVTTAPGTITATLGNVTLDASDNVTIGAAVTADKNVLITAKDGDILTNATVTATTGNVEMTAGLGIEINGAVTAANNVLLTAKGADILTTATVTATAGNVIMDALRNVTIGDTVTADKNVLITAKDGDILTNAAVTATTGNVEMTAGLGIEINGAVTANNDVLLTAKGADILTTAPITATLGDVIMDAFGNVTIGDTVTAGGNVQISAGKDIAINGGVTSANDVVLTSKDGDIQTSAAIVATLGSVIMDAFGNITVGNTVTAGNNVEMTAGLGIAINGAVTAVNDVLLTAKGGDIVTTASVTATLGDVIMDASGNVTIGDTVTAGDNVEMTAGLGIEINDAVTAANNVSLTAKGGDILTTAPVTATLGNVTMDAFGNITIGDTVTAGNDVKMTAGKNIGINGAVTAANDVLLTTIDGDIVTTSAVVATLGDVIMDASGNVTIGATVTAGDDVEMIAGKGIAINDSVTAANNVLLTAKGGDILTTATVTATTGNVIMDAFGNITIGEPVNAGLNVEMTAGSSIKINGAVTAANDVLLTAKGEDIRTTATVTATTGNVIMDAFRNVTIGAAVTANKNVLITAREGFILTTASVAATTDNVEMTAGKSIAINGTVTADKNVLLTAKGGDILTTASVTANQGDVIMDASEDVSIGATVNANKNVNMTAGAGIGINGAVTASKENVLLKANGGDISTTEAVAATQGDVTMDASGSVSIGATVTASNDVLVTARGGNILTMDAVEATLGNVTMDASGNVSIGATVSAGSNVLVTTKDGDIITTAAVDAVRNVKMSAGRNIDINGTVTAGNDVVVTARGGNIISTESIEATQGYVNIDASGNVTLGGASVTAGSNVLVTAREGDIITTAAVEAGENVDMIAGKGIEINGTVTAGDGDISMLASGNDINLNQTVSAANGDVTLEATKGSILGTSANPPLYHVVAKTLKATAAKGIGRGLAALRTNIAKIVGVVTGKGDVVLSQKGDLDADIITEDGAITVMAGGTINATNVVSKTDSDNNDISLTSKEGNILVGNMEAGQGKEADVILNATNGVVETIRPSGKSIIADELIVVAKSGIDLDTNVNRADLVVTHNGNIKINETNDLILKRAQTQGKGSIAVSTGGKLEGINVVAENGYINLIAQGDLTATNVISTTNAKGNDINLISHNGDIIVDYVAAGTGTGGNVTLKAQAGEIRESTPKDSSVDIVGYEVNLHAKGDIGASVIGGIDIKGEILNAYSTEGNISLADVDDIVIRELHAKKGTVKVTAGGFISDDNNNDTKIIAKDLILDSVAGIGVIGDASTRALDTEVGTLTATVSGLGGINIDQKGNLDVKKVITANGNIILVVDGNMGVDFITAKGAGNTVDLKAFGAITDINDTATDKRLNIAADKIKLDGSKGVGTKGNPLEISTSEISAKGGTGGLYLTNLHEGLIIKDYTTDEGDIVITTSGELVINGPVSNLGGGDISLIVTDTGRDDDNIVINAGISASGDGSIYLNADDSVYQNANMTVENKGDVHVSAGDSIYMANGSSTIAHHGNIVYKAANEIELGKLIVSTHPYYGTVTIEAPKIKNNNPYGEAAIEAGYIFVNTNVHETTDLLFGLIGGEDNSYGIWLNDRLVGGLVSRATTFTDVPHMELEFQEYGYNLFHISNQYGAIPMAPVNQKENGYIYDEKSGTWIYKQ